MSYTVVLLASPVPTPALETALKHFKDWHSRWKETRLKAKTEGQSDLSDLELIVVEGQFGILLALNKKEKKEKTKKEELVELEMS